LKGDFTRGEQYLLLELAESAVAVLNDGELDTLVLGEGDEGSVTLTEDEDVSDESGPGVAGGVTEVDNVLSTLVLLAVVDNTNTTQVTTTSGHGEVADLKLDELLEGARGKVKLDGIVDANLRVRVTEGTAVVGNGEGDTLRAEGDLSDLGKLELKRRTRAGQKT
jgi:hypothetical protein